MRVRLLALVALIGTFGLVSAVSRTSVMMGALAGSNDAHSASLQDSILLQTAVGALRLAPQSIVRREMIEDTHSMMLKFADAPWTTLAHVLPAALFMLFAPLQFSRRIRRRAPAFHRWSGRALLVLSLPLVIAGSYFGVREPFAGLPETIPVIVFGLLFAYCGARGFAAIRARDIAAHREWMTRLFAIALGASIQRAISGPLLLATGHGPRAWFVTSVWLGFGAGLVGAELLIRRERVTRVLAPA